MRDKIDNWKDCKSIAIMGGTFDPIHFGHLVTAEAVRHQFHIERVIFIPTGNPPHKKGMEVTHNEHRYLMTVLATVTNNFFDVSRIEIDRTGFTYTIDTVKELRKICSHDTKIYFITGADAVFQILTWKDADTLLSICEFVAVSRPGYEKEKLFNEIENLKNNYETKIHFMEVPALSISSSDIRNRVKNSMPIKYLLPRAVEDYIYKFNIYKNISLEKQYAYDEKAIALQLKTTLSTERFAHTMGVCNEAEKLAENYGADVAKARIAALLHDCAKDIPDDIKKILCKEYQIKLDNVTKKQKELIHCVLGREIAKRNYNINDDDILNAIRYHTTGRPNMSQLEKIIYLADYFEPNRQDFEGLKRIKKLAYKDLDEAMKFALTLTINHIKHKKKELHPLTQQSLDFYTNLKTN